MNVAIIRPPANHGATIEAEGATVFTFDATLAESHSINATATSHPLETGVSVSDHIQVDPAELTLIGIVTNSPLPVEVVSSGSGRDFRAWNALETLLRSRQPLRIVTPLRTYDNMALVSLSASRDALTGQALVPNLTFRELMFSDSLFIEVPPEIVAPVARASSSSRVDAGRTQADQASDAEQDRGTSWAAQAFDSFMRR